MRITLKQLEAFVWVADLQSFRRAADRLNTTQPNISARIASLEQTLGTKLMTRDAGAIHLTGKGQELLTHARRVLHETDSLIAASDRKSLIEGTLRIGVTEMIVHTWLRDYLRHLKEHYPKLVVELTVDMSVQLERGLAERSLDLALQNEPFSRLTTGQIAIGSYDMIWVAAPDPVFDRKMTIDTLSGFPVLTHARDTRLYEEISAHFATRRDLAARLVPSSNLAACLHMALDSMGVAALPAAMVEKDIASGALVQLEYDWVPGPLHFFARFDAERSLRIVKDAAQAAGRVASTFDHKK